MTYHALSNGVFGVGISLTFLSESYQWHHAMLLVSEMLFLWYCHCGLVFLQLYPVATSGIWHLLLFVMLVNVYPVLLLLLLVAGELIWLRSLAFSFFEVLQKSVLHFSCTKQCNGPFIRSFCNFWWPLEVAFLLHIIMALLAVFVSCLWMDSVSFPFPCWSDCPEPVFLVLCDSTWYSDLHIQPL